jgi:hypothetical protein
MPDSPIAWAISALHQGKNIAFAQKKSIMKGPHKIFYDSLPPNIV